MASRYEQVYDAECVEINYKRDPLIWACCDCGLVHRFEYFVEGDLLSIYTWRENKQTAAFRRHRIGNLFKATDGLWKIVRRKKRNVGDKGLN